MSRTIPNCNRSFLIESLLENKRIDNRTFYQFRDLQVNFGQTFGSCYVQLGNTVVYASTEATLDEPRIARPSEGRFKVVINIGAGGKEKWLRNIERSQPTEAILTTRLLEKIINRINVLDLESLCLITGKLVWCISTKLVLLNYDGNLIEASSIAAIASLMHFKRPDATVTPDGDIIVHSFEERNPIPLTLFHYPICVTFQFMDHTHLKKIVSENQEILLEQHKNRVRKATQLMICDPTEEEEDFLNNVLIICANVYKEIVAIQSIGPLSLSSFSKQLLRTCSSKAFERVRFVTDYLKSCLEKHTNFSSNQFQRYNFYEAMKNGDLCVVQNYSRHPVLGNQKEVNSSRSNQKEQSKSTNNNDFASAEEDYGQGGPSKWTIRTINMDNSNDLDDCTVIEENRQKSNDKSIKKPEKKNQWTIVDKKKAATDAEVKATIQKLNEKRTKNKKMNINDDDDDDDDDDEEPVLLKWEFKKKK